MQALFPDTYEESRNRFIEDFKSLGKHWPNSKLESFALSTDSSLKIDYAWAEPRRKQNLVVISTGLHGIEGYVGSAMLKIFMDEFALRLNLENTGLLLVHAINPFGMHVRRRYNENNVDLNRNFLMDENFDPAINPDYDLLSPLLNPQGVPSNLFFDDLVFVSGLINNILRMGILRIRQGMLSGQFRKPRGVQFGGQKTQESAQFMRGLLKKTLEEYDQVVHIDLHTGYGPRYQMSMVNATRESASSEELISRFNYPLIMAATPTDFYTTTGDISEYFYIMRDEKFPTKKLFATCFEFGTFGDSLLAQIRSMRATILENRLFQFCPTRAICLANRTYFGAKTEALRQVVRKEYEELFFPNELKWREKAVADCRQAYGGVFADFGLF